MPKFLLLKQVYTDGLNWKFFIEPWILFFQLQLLYGPIDGVARIFSTFYNLKVLEHAHLSCLVPFYRQDPTTLCARKKTICIFADCCDRNWCNF